MSKSMLQRVELNTFYYVDLHCPFCGKKVVNYGSEGFEPKLISCQHTIFIASDHGFEYRSEEFNSFFNLKEGDLEIDVEGLGFDHIDSMTDAFEAEDGVKFAQYVGSPAGIGGYVGFAPRHED